MIDIREISDRIFGRTIEGSKGIYGRTVKKSHSLIGVITDSCVIQLNVPEKHSDILRYL